jgi:pyridoxal/pyridoxine/pyridoxamine kinase
VAHLEQILREVEKASNSGGFDASLLGFLGQKENLKSFMNFFVAREFFLW